MYLGHINPNWKIEDFYNLNYKKDTHKDHAMIDMYESKGHHRDSMTIYNYFEPSPMPVGVDYIKKHFSKFRNILTAVNLFKPGQYLPYHVDLYQRYKEVTDSYRSDIVRFIVMLEDHCPGQILQIQDTAVAAWKAGDYFGWDDTDWHAFYNFSLVPRYAIQITASLNDSI